MSNWGESFLALLQGLVRFGTQGVHFSSSTQSCTENLHQVRVLGGYVVLIFLFLCLRSSDWPVSDLLGFPHPELLLSGLGNDGETYLSVRVQDGTGWADVLKAAIFFHPRTWFLQSRVPFIHIASATWNFGTEVFSKSDFGVELLKLSLVIVSFISVASRNFTNVIPRHTAEQCKIGWALRTGT